MSRTCPGAIAFRGVCLAALIALTTIAGAAPAAAATGSRYRVVASATLEGSALVVHATLRYGAHSHVLTGATVRFGRKVEMTDAAGDAHFTLSARPRRPLRVTVAKGRLQKLTLTIRPRTSSG
jgi:hypothetical protein